MPSVAPMIHVPDVAAAAAWYESIGFEVLNLVHDGDQPVFALLAFGDGRIMLNTGGTPSGADRREVDLYVGVEEVDALYAELKDRVEVIEPPYDAHHGMRELIIRDLNRFWITFGRPISPISP
ncbi:MAG: hypothetical protein EBR82_04320 [Caulobacteraceae bacterium]|nr:hypothetical protein [Caulobacteraceae bacterium]